MKQSPFLSPNFIRGFTVIIIPHNVELTFPEFHFETEAKVDFPLAYI